MSVSLEKQENQQKNINNKVEPDSFASKSSVGVNLGRQSFYINRLLKVECRDPQKASNEIRFKKQKDPYFNRPERYNDIRLRKAKKKKQRANYFKKQKENNNNDEK